MGKVKFYKIYRRILPGYEKQLEKEIGDCNSLLDVGCGSCSPIKSFSKRLFSVGVDIFWESIQKSKKENIHNKYYNIGVLDIDKKFKDGSFDCVLASDLIEHLSKKEGKILLEKMEKIALKKIVVFTPNGFLHQGEYNNNP